jgi:hypothetical protein
VVAGDVGDRVAQLTDDEGRLFTLDERGPEGADSEVREGPFIAADGVRLPDMDVVIACPFECRWADLVVRVAGAVARVADVPTWVLDGDGVVWAAGAVDPRRVRLRRRIVLGR